MGSSWAVGVIVPLRLLGRLNKIPNVELPAQVLAPNKHLINAVTKEELFCLTTRYFLSFGSADSTVKASRAACNLTMKGCRGDFFLFLFLVVVVCFMSFLVEC